MGIVSTLKVCKCRKSIVESNEKYCRLCRPIGYRKVKDKAQRRWLKKTGKNATFYRRTNPEFKASCKLRDYVLYHADELQVGDII
jgi:hypothetical protein